MLYRLDQVAMAERVYVVEGEKAADKLAALGFEATVVSNNACVSDADCNGDDGGGRGGGGGGSIAAGGDGGALHDTVVRAARHPCFSSV